MAKLTDTQLIVLSKAAQRDDGAASVPDRMNKAAAAKVAASLVARKLMREVRAKPGMSVWRVDESGRNMGLVILRAGRDAIGVEDISHAAPVRVAAESRTPNESDQERQPNDSAPRASSKQALVVAMMSKESGATIDALVAATGWLAHTTRAALSYPRWRRSATLASSARRRWGPERWREC